LKKRCRSPAETWSNSGVSPSYIIACWVAPGGGGTAPYWPDGTMSRAMIA
jgi:hypothetical protein